MDTKRASESHSRYSTHMHSTHHQRFGYIYSPAISTANSFEALNCSIPEGLDNDDVQKDLLARAAMERHIPYVVDFPHDTLDSSGNKDQCCDTGIDGDTTSDSEEELVENFTNDLITPEVLVKPAKKRGRPKKVETTTKPPLLP